MGAVPNSEHPFCWRCFVDSPKEIMVQLDVRRGLEGGDPSTGRIKATAQIFNRAILPASIDGLEDNQDAAPMVGVESFLKVVERFPKLSGPFECVFFRHTGSIVRIDLRETDLATGPCHDNCRF